ncbi:MAG: hypothetical protein CM15mP87_07550 [Candidatus Neomarinimicrobiota bacterium]|nr:MAG: hypothetical protein CM15mP87_07550 [Candidatus Neomarinimicrobiota bacterium]
MVNRELIEVFSEIAREKNVERSELATILEELFLYVIEKEYGDSSNCSCIVNLDKGEIEIYAEKTIVEEIDDYKVEITLEEAIEKEPDASDLEVGDVFVEVIDPRVFGRRLVVTANSFFHFQKKLSTSDTSSTSIFPLQVPQLFLVHLYHSD